MKRREWKSATERKNKFNKVHLYLFFLFFFFWKYFDESDFFLDWPV